MGTDAKFFVVVFGIVVVLMACFLTIGHFGQEREGDIVRNPGNDIIQTEADEYRIANSNQQRGILLVAFIVVLVATAWWIVQRRRGSE